ncbi:hypothetical protein E4U41_006594 [Claviceps citrina]|nr:hypothetical protein E4U41_006594 [Claviceps citrina]
MAAKMRGALPIIAIDLQQSRLHLAAGLGGTISFHDSIPYGGICPREYPVGKLVSVYDFEDYQRAIDDTKLGAALKAVLVWKQ